MKIANSKHNKNSYDFFMKYHMNDLTAENELCKCRALHLWMLRDIKKVKLARS